ncbi:MAG: hypothetical protein ABR555_14480 [Pyrinomonadaceae bacterium]
MASQRVSCLTRTIGRLHLLYLGLLPTFATFGLLLAYGYPLPLLLLLGGTAAVAVYVAVVLYYSPLPASLVWSLLVLFDGPMWALLSLSSKRMFPLGFAVEALIVDGTAVWFSILVLALTSPLPDRRQRLASVGFMLLAFGTAGSLAWPYFRANLWGQWLSLGWLTIGIVEAVMVRFKQLNRDQAAQGLSDTTRMIYLIVLIFAWVASLISGNVLHEKKSFTAPQPFALIWSQDRSD